MESGIVKLPSEVQGLLQSSSIISSFWRAVEELVYNSLDSHATSIAVRIKHADFSIQVIDNGRGMCKEDVDMVGTKFATSKLKDVKEIESISCYYGFRGIALASLIGVSECLKITSRHSGSEVTWAKEYRKGRLERVYETVPRPSHGTTVEIKGLLYNLEIQRKILNPTREVLEIKNFIEHTSILHTGVSFSLRDEVKNAVIVKIPKNKDIYQTIKSIYGLNISENVQELQIEKSPYKVKAFLGKKCIEEDLRLMYLNGRYVENSKLHKLIDFNLSNVFSGIGRANNLKKTFRFTEDIEVNCKLYPFYVLFISCPYNDYDIAQMTGKTLVEFHNWTSINGLLKTLVNIFMEGLEMKNAQTLKNNQPESKAQRAKDERTIQEKVASIVEKIRRSDDKKVQAQKGVKGKPAKRRNKKMKPKLNLRPSNKKHSKINKLMPESIKRTTNTTSAELNLPKHVIQDIKKQTSPKSDKQYNNPSNIKCVPNKNKPKKVHKKKITTNALCVPNREFTKVFEAIDGSVKRRCKDLSKNVAHLMKKYSYKNIQANEKTNFKKIIGKNAYINKIESVEKIINTKNICNHKVESFKKRSGKIVIREFIPFPRICERRKFLQKYLQMYFKDNKVKKEVKSRYDLLQTLIESQKDVPENSFRKIKNNAMKIKEVDKFKVNKELPQDLPILTYESHHYDVNPNSKRHYIDNNFIHAAERNNIPKERDHSKTESRELFNNSNQNILPTKRAKINKIEQNIEKYYGIKTSIIRNFRPKRTDSIARHESGIIDIVAYNKTHSDSNPKNLNETINQTTEYNFDDEVNRQISFSLTSQKIPNFEKHTNCLSEVEAIKQYNNPSIYYIEEANGLGKRKHNDTNVIEESEIVASPTSRVTEQSNGKSSIQHISETINSINETKHSTNISKNYNVILFESIHTTMKEHVFSEPITEDSFAFTDFKKYGYRYSDILDHDNIQVTFESQSYPCNRNSIDSEPLNICQAILESSDIFDTESLYLENSGISKEIQANNAVESNKELKQSYVNINENVKCITNKHDLSENKPNGQESLHNNDINESVTEILRNTFHGSQKAQITTNLNLNLQNSPIIKSPILSVHKITKDKSNTDGEAEKIVEKNANVVERTYGNGKVCYLNVDNGMTYSGNEITTVNDFDLKKRPNYVPKGLSQIFQNENLCTKNTMEIHSQDYFTKSMYEEFVKEVEKGAEVYEPAAQNLAEMTTKETNTAQMRFRKLNASIIFEGIAIKNAKVLRQVDNKFIACLMEGMKYHAGSSASYLVLFDQHAVDERIRLEQLMSEYKKDSVWRTAACNEFIMTLSDEEMFYIENFSNKFKEIGLDWITELNERGKNEISVVSIPAAVVGNHKRKMLIVHNAVRAIIREHVKTLKGAIGAASAPKTLTDLVNTEACRFAVKFGDSLSRDACVDLMSRLAACLAPFQCAHGRPDVAVLLMVKQEERTYKVNMDKIKKLTFNS